MTRTDPHSLSQGPIRLRPTPSIRWAGFLLGLLFLSVWVSPVEGQLFRRFASLPQPIPDLYDQAPTLSRLVADVNARARRVQQLSSNVTIALPGSPKIKGSLQMEFPQRLRLKAGLLGVSEMGVDAGSNEREFWVWSKMDLPNQPAALYYASHEDYRQGQMARQLPLDPRWLLDAIGLFRLEPDDQHYGPYQDPSGRLKVYTVLEQDGQRRTRMLLINATNGLVEQVTVYDAQNRLVAYSNASEFKYYPEYNVSLPQRVALHMSQANQQDLKLVVDFGNYSINSLFGDPQQMWAMPEAPGERRINLGQ